MIFVNSVLAECPEHVIIVGAGTAGLAAAKKLTENSCTVTILEANSRLGGRIKTVPIGGNGDVTDLGASFLHGTGPGAGTSEKW